MNAAIGNLKARLTDLIAMTPESKTDKGQLVCLTGSLLILSVRKHKHPRMVL